MNNYEYIINAFTQDGNNVNEEIDNLTVGCITSKNNNFELDSQGNLTVKSLTTQGNYSQQVNNLIVDSLTSSNNAFELDSQGNLTVNSITTQNGSGSGMTQSEVFNFIYPIGSIYMSLNNTNPSTLFGGTWEAIQDRFLLGAGNNYAVSATGGETTVTLNANQIPSHSHSFSATTTGAGGHSHTGHTKEHMVASSTKNQAFDYARNLYSSCDYTGITITDAVGDHQHSVSGTTGATGGGQAHNNMPPYIAVYMWKRTA